MKTLITGAGGTVGSALRSLLDQREHQSIAWDRQQVVPTNFDLMADYVQQIQPDVLFHLAIASQSSGIDNEPWYINYQWPVQLARICKNLNILMIFTSTVMVFTNDAPGPFTPDSNPDASSGYGYEKRQAEADILYLNSNAVVVRLGWQIGEKAGSNNMIDFFDKQMAEKGKISASRRWLPACSFLHDTADALLRLTNLNPGLYMIDSNRHWNFYEIACALNDHHDHPWIIEATDEFVYDQRMIDPRLSVPPLSDGLPALDIRQ